MPGTGKQSEIVDVFDKEVKTAQEAIGQLSDCVDELDEIDILPIKTGDVEWREKLKRIKEESEEANAEIAAMRKKFAEEQAAKDKACKEKLHKIGAQLYGFGKADQGLIDDLLEPFYYPEYGSMLELTDNELNAIHSQKKKLKDALRKRIDSLQSALVRPKDDHTLEKTHAIFTDHPEADSLYIKMGEAFAANESWAHWLTKKATFGYVNTSAFEQVKNVIFSGPERKKVIEEIEHVTKQLKVITKADDRYLDDDYLLLDKLNIALQEYYDTCCGACSKCLKERRDTLKKGLASFDEVSTNELVKGYLLVAAVCGKQQTVDKKLFGGYYTDYRGVVGKQCLDVLYQCKKLIDIKREELLKKSGEK